MSASPSSMSEPASPSPATRRTTPAPSSTACRSAAPRPAPSTTLNLQLPDIDLVNLSAGIELGDGLGAVVYVNNLFDENAILAFDRERGGRARLGFHVGQPRTMGVTVRKRF